MPYLPRDVLSGLPPEGPAVLLWSSFLPVQPPQPKQPRLVPQVEKLSGREVLRQLHISHRRLKRLLGAHLAPGRPKRPSALQAYRHLLSEWYRQYPRLQAAQVHRRLREYGYAGSLSSVERFTRVWRIRKPVVYHALDFVPGELEGESPRPGTTPTSSAASPLTTVV